MHNPGSKDSPMCRRSSQSILVNEIIRLKETLSNLITILINLDLNSDLDKTKVILFTRKYKYKPGRSLSSQILVLG